MYMLKTTSFEYNLSQLVTRVLRDGAGYLGANLPAVKWQNHLMEHGLWWLELYQLG